MSSLVSCASVPLSTGLLATVWHTSPIWNVARISLLLIWLVRREEQFHIVHTHTHHSHTHTHTVTVVLETYRDFGMFH